MVSGANQSKSSLAEGEDSSARSFILKVVNDAGKDVAPDICQIVGADGGYVTGGPRPFPSGGLLTSDSYR